MAKMKSVSIVLVLGIGIIFALSVALMSYKQIQKKFKSLPQQTKAQATQMVAVAAYDLTWGTLIDDKMIKMAPFLKESLPPGAFSDAPALAGRTLLYPVQANEPIFESKLAPTTVKSGGIAAIVTPKKRAMSVKVDNVVGISGFIHPGNRVDVLVTMAKDSKSDIHITKTVLENVLVIAAGTDVDEDKKQKSKGVEVITLEVTPEEGEKLALATSQGKIQLALRNFTDNEHIFTRGATVTNLLASYGIAEGVAAKSIETPVFSVMLIKGKTVGEVAF